MIRLSFCVAVFASLLLVACAGSSEQTSQTAGVPAATRDLFRSSTPDGLPPQRLAQGECGLFLWGQTPPHRFVFFSKADSGAGIVLIDKAAVDLRVMDTGGAIFGEFSTRTQYSTADGVRSVTVAVEPGEMLEDGQRISSGKIVSTDQDGWQTIFPVLGVRACIPG